MQDQEIWNKISKHLSEKESTGEKELFLKWLNEKQENKDLFEKLKVIWDDEKLSDELTKQKNQGSFFSRFTKKKIKDFVLKQALGHLIGFLVGMWVTSSFSHNVLERRSLKNLYGLNGRKQVAVNDIPEWVQNGIAILLGFITLELITHFFQSQKHIVLLNYLKGTSKQSKLLS